MYADVGDDEVTLTSSVAFVAERHALFQKAFTLAKEMLGRAAEWSRKRYDMRVKPTSYNVGDWVYYFCRRHRVRRLPKWQRFDSGPFLVVEILGAVNLRIQKSARAYRIVVHVDKVKQCLGKTPISWLGTEPYNVIPNAMEPDVLSNMFLSVNRGGISTSVNNIETNVTKRLKRNTCVPARFLSRIYAVDDDASSNVYDYVKNERIHNHELCLYRFSDMKKTAKRTEFEYKCFTCQKQDDKARSYTRSYDLILHTVNTYRKYPVDVRHNTYYAADGSDLRDATEEELEKYRLAAAHKKRKPESRVGVPPWYLMPGRTTRPPRGGQSARGRDTEWRPRDKESKDERERTSSRGSKGGRAAHTREHSRDDATLKVGEGSDRGRSSEREKKSRNSIEDVDEDEPDRRKMAEIVRRMEDRAATKESDVVRKTAADARRLDPVADATQLAEYVEAILQRYRDFY